jgi:small subunit ribosomal protein S16
MAKRIVAEQKVGDFRPLLKIRLRRTGAKKQPRYRVVVADSRAPRDGAFVEVIGWYNPQADPAQVVVNTERADAWLKRGAQPSDRVAYLLKQARLGPPPEPAEAAPEPAAAPRRRTSRAARSEAAGQETEPAVAESVAPPAAAGAEAAAGEDPPPGSTDS